MKITYSQPNSKLRKLAQSIARAHGIRAPRIYSMDLPAGHSCPFADACQARADRETGAITDGPSCRYRCYAASAEVQYASGLPSCTVAFDPSETTLPIDADDSHAYEGAESFALLVHGTQPRGSAAGKAVRALRLSGLIGAAMRKVGA